MGRRTIRKTLSGPMTATWSTSDNVGAGLVLSNGNLTAANNGGGISSGRATLGVSSGSARPHVFWEVKANSYAFFPLVGICTQTETLSDSLGLHAGAWTLCYYAGAPPYGYTYHSGSFAANGINYVAGDTMGFDLNMSTGILNLYWNGTLVSGAAISGLTGTIYPCYSTYGGNDYNFTANFGADLVGHPFVATQPAGSQLLHS